MVQDESGAALPDAQVTLHSVGENTDRSVTADASGGFTIENVKPGEYLLRVDRSGFSETVMRGIVVEARQDVRRDGDDADCIAVDDGGGVGCGGPDQ